MTHRVHDLVAQSKNQEDRIRCLVSEAEREIDLKGEKERIIIKLRGEEKERTRQLELADERLTVLEHQVAYICD